MCKSVNIFVFRSYQCCPGALRVENVCKKLHEIAALNTKMAAIQNILKVTSLTQVCLK